MVNYALAVNPYISLDKCKPLLIEFRIIEGHLIAFLLLDFQFEHIYEKG